MMAGYSGKPLATRLRGDVDIWHLFVSERRDLETQIPRCVEQIVQNGMIWVSWPKKSSGIQVLAVQGDSA